MTTNQVSGALCRVLRDGNEAHRCFAAQALGHIGHSDAYDALIDALGDVDEDVRADAAEALGRLGDSRAAPALVASLLDDPCGDVKVNAAAALGRLGATEAVPVLRRFVRDRDASVVWDDEGLQSGGWDDWLDVQVRAVEALGRIGAVDAVPDIVAAVDEELGQDLDATAMKALARLGAPGLSALSAYLAAPDERLRKRSAAVLATVGDEAAVAVLAKALADRSPGVRVTAARAVGARNPGDDRLVSLLEDVVPRVRAEGVRLCGRRRPERLTALIEDPNDEVRAAVLGALADGPSLEATGDLARRIRSRLGDDAEDVAVAAIATVAAVLPDIALYELADRLHDRNAPAEVRGAAARALAGIGTEAAAHALVQAIDDGERQVRLATLVALVGIAAAGGGLAREALIAALAREQLSTPAPDGAAAKTGDDAPAADDSTRETDDVDDADNADETDAAAPDWPTSTLDSILGEGNAPVLREAAEEKIELSEEDLGYLELTRRRPGKKRVSPRPRIPAREDVPRLAARVLGNLVGDDIAHALAAVLADPDAEARRAAADSLARLGERAGALADDIGAALVVACADTDDGVRLAAARALGRAHCLAGERALAGLLADRQSFVRAEAARSLALIEAAGREVESLLADDDPGVRLAAAWAIATQHGAAALDRLVAFAFAFGGYHRREAARLLRQIDGDGASARFLEVLADRAREREWRISIEALEELHHPVPERTASPRSRERVVA